MTVHKIGVDARTFSVPNPGGAVRTGIELTKELNKTDSDLTIFGHSSVSSRLNGIPIESYGYAQNSKALGMIWEQTALPKRASEIDIDILYSPVAYCPLISTPFPCAITIHDLSSFRGHSAGWYNQFEQLILPRMATRADIIFTVSEFSKSKICSELDVPESKVSVVYNGVSDMFHSDRRFNIDINLPESYLLYVGALSTRKNISGLLAAFRMLKQNYDIKQDLVLIGPEDDPTNKSDIDPEMIDPIRDSIVQLGYVTDEELKEAYSSADLFVFPSLYEGFGIPPLEAMACKTPVVASDRTSIPEILGDAAEYFNPENTESMAESIFRVLNDSELKTSLVKKGTHRADIYRWSKSAEKLHGVLSGEVDESVNNNSGPNV